MSAICATSPSRTGRDLGVVVPHTSFASASYRVRWDRIGAIAVAVVLFVVVFAGLAGGRSAAESVPAAPIHVVVQSSDTLWDLAATHAPSDMAPMEYAALVESVNGIRAGRLVPGSVLELPQS